MFIKRLLTVILAIVACMSLHVKGQSSDNCRICLSVPYLYDEKMPTEVAEQLQTKLAGIVAQNGVAICADGAQFFLGAKLLDSSVELVNPSDPKYMVRGEMFLYIGDAAAKQIYASMTVPIKAIDRSESRAFAKAINAIYKKSNEINELIDEGSAKIVNYYDTHWKEILETAKRSARYHKFGECLYILSQMPYCCKGFWQARDVTKEVYKYYIDEYGAEYFVKAQSAWAANPNTEGASAAFEYLEKIDPHALAFPEAQKLAKTIMKATGRQWKWKNVDKPMKEMEFDAKALENARAIGMQYGVMHVAPSYQYVW